MIYLLALFVFVPMLELMLLIEIGKHVGFVPTLVLILVTGVVGASLARQQGMGVWRRIQQERAQGRLPAGELVDGLIILVAGAVLMTPGLLTDVFGFFCLIPAGRKLLKGMFLSRIERSVQKGTVRVSVNPGEAPRAPRGPRGEPPREPMRNVTPPSQRDE